MVLYAHLCSWIWCGKDDGIWLELLGILGTWPRCYLAERSELQPKYTTLSIVDGIVHQRDAIDRL